MLTGVQLWQAIKQGRSIMSEAEQMRALSDANPNDHTLALAAADAEAEASGGDALHLMAERARIRFTRACEMVTGKTARAKRCRRIVRDGVAGGSTGVVQIEVHDGDDPPVVRGESGHYCTPAGRRVWYPNAYRRSYGKVVYVCSTRSVHVGSDWILIHCS